MIEMFQRHADEGLDMEWFETFFERYHHHNYDAWMQYRLGKINKDTLRKVRIKNAFLDLNQRKNDAFITRFSNEYFEISSRKPHLLDGAEELLKYCKKKYNLHIITNGFAEVLDMKMNTSGIASYFDQIITSEDVGVQKPNPDIFLYALKKAGANQSESLMVGDDWEADILGARDSGMDQAFINSTELMMNNLGLSPAGTSENDNYQSTFSIQSLNELRSIL